MEIIKEISAPETFMVRHLVLRPGKPPESCHFDGDSLETTKHFGLYEDNDLAGVVTVLENDTARFGYEKQFQIRGMAVLEQYRKKGYGDLLLLAAEKYIQNHGGQLIWFNAREIAVGFYERSGYKKAGSFFEIPGVGPHYVMYKNL